MITLLVLLALSVQAHGFAVSVDAHEKECYYDDVKAGTKMGLTFQVADGGFLDIDVSVSWHGAQITIALLSSFGLLEQITGPDQKEIYTGERETDGKYTFSAHVDGRYV